MLDLRFSIQGGRVEVSCDLSNIGALQQLRSRFGTAASISSQSFDVELDDLLVNLAELLNWPDSDFRWDRSLVALVEGNAEDATVLAKRLETPTTDRIVTDIGDLRLGTSWSAPLTDFQRRDLASLQELTHGANFSVPGAGKTRVALALFQARRESKAVTRMLVVSPKSAFESWINEASKCFASEQLRVLVMESATPPACDLLLINYERLPDARTALLSWLRSERSMLTLDEAHRMKLGPQGAWGAACLALAPFAVSRLILSGTPAPNGARDLENVLGFVWPGQATAQVASAARSGNLKTASRLLRPLFVRTTKAELQLPPVNLVVRRIHLPKLHRELYDALLGQATGRFGGGEAEVAALGRVLLYLLMAATTPALLATGSSRYDPLPYRIPPLDPPTDSTLASLLRDLPHFELSPKYQEVASIVATNSAQGRKTLVWSTFVRNLTSLDRLLGRFNPAIVHGGTENREAELRRFREDPSCTVLLSNPATLGEGISLHHVCNDAVYVDRDFAAGRFLQSLDRIHRLGLAPDVTTNITVLIADQTIDEVIEQRLATKLKFIGSVLDDPGVLALSDLEEEPSQSAGMDDADLAALIGYLGDHVST